MRYENQIKDDEQNRINHDNNNINNTLKNFSQIQYKQNLDCFQFNVANKR